MTEQTEHISPVERAAIALMADDIGATLPVEWDTYDEEVRQEYRGNVRAVLKAVGYQALLDIAEAAQKVMDLDSGGYDDYPDWTDLKAALGKLPQLQADGPDK